MVILKYKVANTILNLFPTIIQRRTKIWRHFFVFVWKNTDKTRGIIGWVIRFGSWFHLTTLIGRNDRSMSSDLWPSLYIYTNLWPLLNLHTDLLHISTTYHYLHSDTEAEATFQPSEATIRYNKMLELCEMHQNSTLKKSTI